MHGLSNKQSNLDVVHQLIMTVGGYDQLKMFVCQATPMMGREFPCVELYLAGCEDELVALVQQEVIPMLYEVDGNGVAYSQVITDLLVSAHVDNLRSFKHVNPQRELGLISNGVTNCADVLDLSDGDLVSLINKPSYGIGHAKQTRYDASNHAQNKPIRDRFTDVRHIDDARQEILFNQGWKRFDRIANTPASDLVAIVDDPAFTIQDADECITSALYFENGGDPDMGDGLP